ncbi:hypothetical protein, partial [uncultured Gammaproteobacteria bacterium]
KHSVNHKIPFLIILGDKQYATIDTNFMSKPYLI